MRYKTSNGTAGLWRQRMPVNVLYAFGAAAVLGLTGNRASAAPFSPSAVDLIASSGGGGGGGGGGAMAPLTLLAFLTLVVVGWWRTRSAFLLSEREPESESGDLLP